MNVNCNDLNRILERNDAQEMAALEAHAAGCEACRRQLELDREISAAAPLLQKSWESPELWPRIHQTLAEESQRAGAPKRGGIFGLLGQWQLVAAALVLVVITAATTWMFMRRNEGPQIATPPMPKESPQQAAERLLTDKAFDEVQQREAEYVKSIDRLAELAKPKLARADSPLLLSYREKLLVLDSAIADLRGQAEQNKFNAHLRNELVEIYRMKQETLREVLQQ